MPKKYYFLILSIILFLVACIIPFKTNQTIIEPVEADTTNDIGEVAGINVLKTDIFKKTEINFIDSPTKNSNAPIINAERAIVIDADTNEILYAKNETQRKPIASIVKIMTAIVAMEIMPLDYKVKVSKFAGDIGEGTMGIDKDEEFTLEELLYGLILNSGNDAAYAIAEAGGNGDYKNFVKLMNIKAESLGLKDSKFPEPSGLNQYEEEFYSTPIDVAKMSLYSRKFEKLNEIYKTVQRTLPESDKHPQKELNNETNLLTSYPGVIGMKTGYTEEAGLCLVSYAENEGKKVLVVVLGSTDRRGDAIVLLDYAFNKMGIPIEHNLLEE